MIVKENKKLNETLKLILKTNPGNYFNLKGLQDLLGDHFKMHNSLHDILEQLWLIQSLNPKVEIIARNIGKTTPNKLDFMVTEHE